MLKSDCLLLSSIQLVVGGLTERIVLLQVYACKQSMPGHPEDHTLSTVHQIMEVWLEVASGLLQNVDNKVKTGNFEVAAKSCWVLERVWKLLISTMDLLQIMDPDDFMRLKEELAISQDGTAVSTEHIGGGTVPQLPELIPNPNIPETQISSGLLSSSLSFFPGTKP